MYDPRVDGLERTVNVLIERLASAEAEIARLGQLMWQIGAAGGGTSAGGAVQIATGGGVPAKASGVLGSATYTLQTLDPATGLLSAGPTAKVWNNGTNAVSNPVVVAKDTAGNWIVITEFCP